MTNSNGSISFKKTNITFTANSLVDKSNWRISKDCLYFSAGKEVISYSSNGAYAFANSNFRTLSPIALDYSYGYALVQKEIWKFDNTSTKGTYKSYMTNISDLFDANTVVRSYQNRLILYTLSATSAFINVFGDNGTVLTKILEVQYTSFASTPKIILSPGLTKFIIFGTTASGLFTDFYFIDYDNKLSQNLDFPTTSVIDPANTLVLLEENWLYVRQLASSKQTVAGGNQQFFYSIQYNVTLVLSKSQSISQSEESTWLKTIISATASNDLHAYTQLQQTASSGPIPVLVTKIEIIKSQMVGRASLSGSSIGGVVSNGVMKLCTAGCSDCSNGYCSACYSGYMLDPNTNTCLICGENCLTCDVTNTKLCFTCAVGSFLSGTSCLPCDTMCVSCSGTAKSCQSCPPSEFFDITTSQCSSCPRNCATCSDGSTCTLCRNGFALSGTTCRSCVISCSTCDPSDINTCTSCYKGLELKNGACVSCPDKCTSCSKGYCAICIDGYHPNSVGVCVMDCELPCATCTDNKPTQCLSCFGGSNLSGKTCVQDLSCNNYKNCTSCGQGNGYILLGAYCYSCSPISKCIQCRTTNISACSLCENGYYINSVDTCSACPSKCISCISEKVCLSCREGYTFAEGFTSGRCLSCTSPCKTCSGSQTSCASCVSGYSKTGWKCESNKNVGFKINLNGDNLATLLLKIDQIVIELLKLLKISETNIEAITFASIKKGSIILVGTATPPTISDTSVLDSSTALTSGLTSSTSIGGLSVSSSSITPNGV